MSSPAHRRRRSSGFTLIEMLVVVVLLGLVMGVAVRGMRSLANSDLRSSAIKMSGAIRYLFDRASTTGRVHRLVIDFQEGRYWAEVSDDRILIGHGHETDQTREEEAAAIAREDEEARKLEQSQEGESAPAVDITHYQPQEFRPKRARFSSFKEMAIKPVQVKGVVKIASLFTPRLAEPMSTGQGYIYFFPMGLTEAAQVYLSDEKGETFYTLVVHPLTGRVGVHNSYIQPPVDAQFDDEGTRVGQ